MGDGKIQDNMTQQCNKMASESENRTGQISKKSSITGQFLIRLEEKLDPLSLLKWLKNQIFETKIYWASRQRDLEIAAVGLVDSIDPSNTTSFEQALSTVEARLKKSCPHIRYYGGQSFDSEKIDLAEWNGFGQYRFIVPKYEIIRNDNTYTLARNVRVDSEINTDELRQQIREFMSSSRLSAERPEETVSDQKSACQLLREDVPCRSEWISLAQQLVRTIHAGDVEKVVLAHKANLVSASSFNPVTLLECMNRVSSQTYSFLFRFPDSGVFLGSSPECLFKKDGQDVQSEAIAGTRPTARDQRENLKLGQELCQSAKELQEHGYVVDNIYAALQTICEDVCSAEPCQILQTASVQHLYTRFRGKLAGNITICDIINALHPTAAVNGIPSKKATEQIRSLEPFSRGWYAGPVGWIMSERAEFSVAIRSALVQQDRMISIYSGAGFVKDSKPEQEWAETELKKRLILEAAKEIIY